MPSLLQKNSFFDPEVGRQFVATDHGFYWKEAKKSPEDSKVTKLLQSYGWELKNGNDVWLIFKRPGKPGELFVIRGEKKWYFDMPNEPFGTDVPEGQGLASLQKALENDTFGDKAKAMHAGAPSSAVNNAGNGHGEVTGNPLFERRVAAKPTCPHCGSDDYGLMPSDFETAKCNDCGKNWDHGIVEGINNPYSKAAAGLTPKAQAAWQTIQDSGQKEFEYYGAGGARLADGTKIHSHIMKSLIAAKLVERGPGIKKWYDTGGAAKDPWTWVVVEQPKTARETMHDDSGARTGLRSRPDYGESDSYTVEMNEANAKDASILVLDGSTKTAKAKLYVTGATFDGMTLEKFTFSPDRRKAHTFGKLTAQNLRLQLKGKFGVTANVLPAKA